MNRHEDRAQRLVARGSRRPSAGGRNGNEGCAEPPRAPPAHLGSSLCRIVGLVVAACSSAALAAPSSSRAAGGAAETPSRDERATGDEGSDVDGPPEGGEAGARERSSDGASALAPSGSEESSRHEDRNTEGEAGWSDFELGGAHGFLGIAVGPALMGDWYFGNPPDWHPGMLLAIRGGALFDHVELAAEIAPVSMWWTFSEPPLFSFNVTIGGQLEIAPNVYWPLRFGLGATAVNMPHDTAAMQARLDLIGIIYRVGHVELEVDLLSARFSSEFQDFGLWSAPFTLAGSYVF